MAFGDRQYRVYVVLGDRKGDPAWAEPKWDALAKAVDPVIGLARGPAAVTEDAATARFWLTERASD